MGANEKQAPGLTEAELWALAFKRLVGWAVKKHRMNQADAEETVQAAIRLFLQAGGKADPSAPKALFEALGSNVNGIAVNRRRKKAELAVGLTADGSAAELADPPSLERQIVDGQIARKAISTLLERVEHDALATAIVVQTSEGVEDPAAQATALGLDLREVYNARRRLKAHVEAVQRLMVGW